MKSNEKSAKQTTKAVKAVSRAKSGRPAPKNRDGEVDGPDERQPQTKADEIYGDTKIPQRGGKS